MHPKNGKTIGVLQARTGSTRLPSKVLADICGQPMLTRIIRQIKRAQRLGKLVVATTVLPEDDPVVELAEACGVDCFRGHPTDCLDRCFGAAREHQAAVVVRLTGDNPLVDSAFIDRTINEYYDHIPPPALLSSAITESLPTGLSVEVISIEALETAWLEDENPASREHVTPYILRDRRRFKVISASPGEGDYRRMRWTVDTADDLDFIRAVVTMLEGREDIDWQTLAKTLEKENDILAINSHVMQKVTP